MRPNSRNIWPWGSAGGFCQPVFFGKGQAALEALLVMAVFFFVLARFATLELSHAEKAGGFADELEASASSEKCSTAISAMGTNPGALLAEWNEKCYGKGDSIVYYSDGNIEKGSKTLAKKIQTIQKGGIFETRIENETHYR